MLRAELRIFLLAHCARLYHRPAMMHHRCTLLRSRSLVYSDNLLNNNNNNNRFPACVNKMSLLKYFKKASTATTNATTNDSNTPCSSLRNSSAGEDKNECNHQISEEESVSCTNLVGKDVATAGQAKNDCEKSGASIDNISLIEEDPKSGIFISSSDLPSAWTLDLYRAHKMNRSWLLCEEGKLGCSICKSVGSFPDVIKKGRGSNISLEWADVQVSQNGNTRSSQLSSLRKKMKEHEESAAHRRAFDLKASDRPKPIVQAAHRMVSTHVGKTEKVFRTAYKVAVNANSFLEFEKLIELQQANGCDMGRILHSNVTCVKIINHISKEMKAKAIKHCIGSNLKFSVLLDESTSLSKKSCLIVYVRAYLTSKAESPCTFLLDLVELPSNSANGIKAALIECLNSYGFTNSLLTKNWLGIATDGCSTMLGKKGGLVKLLQDEYPSLIPWHCMAHRLELAVGDALSACTETNHFKSFVDKVYSLYSMSPKNQRQLAAAASSLNTQLLKIGKIFTIRWVASSVRTAKAIWTNYPALFKHFSEAAADTSRSHTERVMFEGLATQLSSLQFLQNLALMHDTLDELASLSLELQKNSINLPAAHKKIIIEKQALLHLKDNLGVHEQEINEIDDSFHGVSVTSNTHVRRIKRAQFIQSIIDSLTDRMFTSQSSHASADQSGKHEYEKLVKDLAVLDSHCWTTEQAENCCFADDAIRRLCRSFRVTSDHQLVVRAFRDYVASGAKLIQPLFREMLQNIDALPISTAECERGFSRMNLIMTSDRASMLVPTLASNLFIATSGPPLCQFDPRPYVLSWLQQGNHLATDKNSLAKKQKIESSQLQDLWDLLN